jgi:hypothetical protein
MTKSACIGHGAAAESIRIERTSLARILSSGTIRNGFHHRIIASLQTHVRSAIFPRSMNQKNISNLATPAGRQVYQEYWIDLVTEQRAAVLPSLWRLWRVAAFGSEIRITSTDTLHRIGHPLGPRNAMRVFMEEIIVRHYFNNVQALVYFGAVILLIFLGLRFAGLLSEEVALIGIGIEALMCLVLFTVLFYSPEDEHHAPAQSAEEVEEEPEDEQAIIREVLEEIEEIGSSYASLGLRLEHLAKAQEESIRELGQRVEAIQGLSLLQSHAERLETTNTLLTQLTGAIDGMNKRIDMLFGKELEYHVRQELERILARDMNGTARAAEERNR